MAAETFQQNAHGNLDRAFVVERGLRKYILAPVVVQRSDLDADADREPFRDLAVRRVGRQFEVEPRNRTDIGVEQIGPAIGHVDPGRRLGPDRVAEPQRRHIKDQDRFFARHIRMQDHGAIEDILALGADYRAGVSARFRRARRLRRDIVGRANGREAKEGWKPRLSKHQPPNARKIPAGNCRPTGVRCDSSGPGFPATRWRGDGSPAPACRFAHRPPAR